MLYGSQAYGSEDRKGKTMYVISIYLCEGELLALPGGKESEAVDLPSSGQMISLRDKPYWGLELASVASRLGLQRQQYLDWLW